MNSDIQIAENIVRLINELSSNYIYFQKNKSYLQEAEAKHNEIIKEIIDLFSDLNKNANTDEAVWIGKVLTNLDELKEWIIRGIVTEFENNILRHLIDQTKSYNLDENVILARLKRPSNKDTIKKALKNLINPIIPIFEIPNGKQLPNLSFLTNDEVEKLNKVVLDESNIQNSDSLIFYPQNEYTFNSRVKKKWIENQPHNNNFKKIVNFCLLLNFNTYKGSNFLNQLAKKLIINFPYFKSLVDVERNIGVRTIQKFWTNNNCNTKELYDIMSNWFELKSSTIEQICYNTEKYPNH